ncbi:hypothetical protein [Anabaena azotica]|uniref:Uncharacterized protein n=1 Tax=Anabaena azotica FACHB-119 TaxID=947527 RepID=A0ABR8D566_9NOST|nr:hypothetical protein [Anabaena azotica]MBD2502096.1 hypothetical protein [Anabaena azotica FACHB-119]
MSKSSELCDTQLNLLFSQITRGLGSGDWGLGTLPYGTLRERQAQCIAGDWGLGTGDWGLATGVGEQPTPSPLTSVGF